MRKGNLMSVRHDVRLLDATIRDGGLCNNFNFTDEFVRELYKTNIKYILKCTLQFDLYAFLYNNSH